MSNEIKLTKINTEYAVEHTNLVITANEEYPHVSIHEYGEPCSGVLRHWGTVDELVEECEKIIKALKAFKNKDEK